MAAEISRDISALRELALFVLLILLLFLRPLPLCGIHKAIQWQHSYLYVTAFS